MLIQFMPVMSSFWIVSCLFVKCNVMCDGFIEIAEKI